MKKPLREYMKGLYIGIDTFNFLSSNCEYGETRDLLTSIEKLYIDQKLRCEKKLEELGIKIPYSAGIKSRFSETVYELRNSLKKDKEEKLREKAIEALLTSIKNSEEFLLEDDINDDIRSFIENMIAEYKDKISELN
ncbi:Hypothetical protein CM240_0362 [Clostridium bornimense]|uniref:Uncharacterized protein n=1 Tax=Clostridium bornimense TaxID=1216932 RepID=W6RVA3_9CLOT|nr:hypothetical protein [Clostridium bornimense]CDM67529.1 Hypothetical protein CM240_0362 [Clostridium bornimense]